MNIRITLTGTAPLIMHNGRLIDPLDPATKALKRATGKRNKTDDDYEEVARLEHFASLYIDPDVGPYIPGDNVWRALYDAAKKRKMGPRIKEGVIVTSDVNPIAYSGPRDADGLWTDANYRLMAPVKVSMSRVMRCRPIFRNWRTEVEAVLDPSVIDLADLNAIADVAGQLIGLGDWRPRYGRFVGEVTAA